MLNAAQVLVCMYVRMYGAHTVQYIHTYMCVLRTADLTWVPGTELGTYIRFCSTRSQNGLQARIAYARYPSTEPANTLALWLRILGMNPTLPHTESSPLSPWDDLALQIHFRIS